MCDVSNESPYTVEECFQTSPVMYRLMATASINGSINPFGETYVQEGSGFTYIFWANQGYVVSELIIDGVNITVPSSSSYTFGNIMSDHTIHVNFAPGVGIDDYDYEASITLYPNPTNHNTALKLENVTLKSNNAEIYDAYGKLVQLISVFLPNTTIDVSTYAPGIYFVRLNTETGFVTKRLIKQ
jgi:hypothetical protein